MVYNNTQTSKWRKKSRTKYTVLTPHSSACTPSTCTLACASSQPLHWQPFELLSCSCTPPQWSCQSVFTSEQLNIYSSTQPKISSQTKKNITSGTDFSLISTTSLSCFFCLISTACFLQASKVSQHRLLLEVRGPCPLFFILPLLVSPSSASYPNLRDYSSSSLVVLYFRSFILRQPRAFTGRPPFLCWYHSS